MTTDEQFAQINEKLDKILQILTGKRETPQPPTGSLDARIRASIEDMDRKIKGEKRRDPK